MRAWKRPFAGCGKLTFVKINDLRNDAGLLTGFAISNLFLRRRGISRIVRSISGATIIRGQPRFRVGGRDDFLEFVIDGVTLSCH